MEVVIRAANFERRVGVGDKGLAAASEIYKGAISRFSSALSVEGTGALSHEKRDKLTKSRVYLAIHQATLLAQAHGMYVCMYVYIYIYCMYVCIIRMYVCIYIYIYIYI